MSQRTNFSLLIRGKELLKRSFKGASLVAQRLKHLPRMQETRVRSLSREDPLEKEMATDREARHPAVHGVAKSWMQLN